MVWRDSLVRLSEDGAVSHPSEALSADTGVSLSFDESGRPVVGTEYGLVEIAPGAAAGSVRLSSVPDGGFDALFRGPEGRLWGASSEGMRIHASDGRHLGNLNLGASTAPVRVHYVDAGGAVWIGTNGGGLVRVSKALFQVIDASQGLVHEVLLSLTQTVDGDQYLSTNCGGIYRRSGGSIKPFSTQQIPSDICSFAVLGTSDGSLWVGHRELVRIQGSRVEVFGEDEGLAPNPGGRSDFVLALYEDPDEPGVLWVGTHGGMHRLEGGRLTRFTEESGLVHNQVRGFARGPGGRLWIATRGGLSIYDGARFKNHSMRTGLPTDDIRSFQVDSKGHMWVGTYGAGLLRFGSDGQKQVSTTDGLAEDVVSSITLRGGWFWMAGNRGIHRTPEADLNQLLAGSRERVAGIGYGAESGLLNPETNGGFQPATFEDNQGRLWYPTLKGAAIVSPDDVPDPTLPARAHLDGVVVGGALKRLESGVELGPSERTFEIVYSAPDLRRARYIDFEYRLTPLEATWTSAGDRRVAYYTQVPPGEYRFEVRSVSPTGERSPHIASATLRVVPRWFERALVRLLFGAGVLGIIVGAAISRWRAAVRRAEELDVQVAKKTSELNTALGTLKIQADKLQEMDRAKTAFFENTSHEFRTPLTLIQAPLSRLLEHKGLSGEQREMVSLARRNSQRLQLLVDDLLDLARVEAGTLPLQRSRVDLVAYLRAQANLFAGAAQSRGVSLTFTADVDRLIYHLDTAKLESILSNLVTNAVKHTPEGGLVWVKLETGAEYVVLEVRDTGSGISAEELPHLFDRFFRGGSTPTSAKGTGIGLALTRELVHLHEGTIVAESGGELSGTTVKVSLPNRWREAPGASFPDSSECDSDSRPLVLVVEDDEEMCGFIASCLSDGFRVLRAGDGESGLQVAITSVPDLVVTDLVMPGMSGDELTRRMKEHPATSHVPVVMLTARSDTQTAVEGVESGADAFLPKPFDPGLLIARVRNLIEGRAALRKSFGRVSLAEPPREADDAESKFLGEVLGAIGGNLDNAGFSVDQLADAVSLSPRQLSRKLRAVTDEGPGELLRRLRLEHAADLLELGARVAEAASQCGYRNPRHFSSAFSSHFGVPPSRYGKNGQA